MSVPACDLARADAWYEALFGRPADNRPMPEPRGVAGDRRRLGPARVVPGESSLSWVDLRSFQVNSRPAGLDRAAERRSAGLRAGCATDCLSGFRVCERLEPVEPVDL
jgi:hypothetical protein